MKIEKTLSNKMYVYSFIMTMAIVIYHCSGWCFSYVYDFTPYLYNNCIIDGTYLFFESFGSLGLGFFFCQSSFLLYYGCDKANAKQRIKKRIITMGIPFLVWNILPYIDYYRQEISSKPTLTFLREFILEPRNMPLWYSISVLFYLIFVPVFLFIGCKTLRIIFLIGLIVSFYICILYDGSLKDIHYWFYVRRLVMYIPAYLFGIVLGLDNSLRLKLETLSNKMRAFSFIGYIVSLGIYLANFSSALNWWILTFQPLLLWISVSDKIFTKSISVNLKFTFLIYVSHFSMKENIPFIILYFGFKSPNILWVLFYVLFFAVVIYFLNFILFHILDKILPKKAWLFITGGR